MTMTLEAKLHKTTVPQCTHQGRLIVALEPSAGPPQAGVT